MENKVFQHIRTFRLQKMKQTQFTLFTVYNCQLLQVPYTMMT